MKIWADVSGRAAVNNMNWARAVVVNTKIYGRPLFSERPEQSHKRNPAPRCPTVSRESIMNRILNNPTKRRRTALPSSYSTARQY